MSNKFRDKYRIPSTRLPHWNYSDNGYYFITVCTKDKEELFGQINNNNIHLSKIGMITQKCWIEIPNHFPFVELDEYEIMPNHVHGIIVIRNAKPFVGAGFPRPSLGQIIGYFKYQITKQINILKGSGNPTPTKNTLPNKFFNGHIMITLFAVKKNFFASNNISRIIR